MRARLISQQYINSRYYLMRLHAPEIARDCRPGQFVMIGLGGTEGLDGGASYDPLLRRPFSLYDQDPSAGWIEVLYKVQGRGTSLMASWAEDKAVDCAGPFGHGFEMEGSYAVWLLVGGGVGIPPLLTAADALARRSPASRKLLLVGGRSALDIVYRKIPGLEVRIATEDGSQGTPGRVTALLESALGELPAGPEGNAVVLTCGPNPMMRAVAQIAAAHRRDCQVSLENRMGCALGVCLGCVVPAAPDQAKRYPRVCTEGPVFDARRLDWESPHWSAM